MKRELWLIWKNQLSRKRYKVGKLVYNNSEYVFEYFKDLIKDNEKEIRLFPGFDNINEVYKSGELFSNIMTRLLNEGRPDYLEILNIYGLDKNSTKLDILQATKGRLITDNYEFVLAFNKDIIEFDIAGTRHCSDLKKIKNKLKINDKLYLKLDSNNKYDKYAIRVLWKNENKEYHIGYVPRYYSKELTELLEKGVEYSALIKSLKFDTVFSDEDITANVKILFNKKI